MYRWTHRYLFTLICYIRNRDVPKKLMSHIMWSDSITRVWLHWDQWGCPRSKFRLWCLFLLVQTGKLSTLLPKTCQIILFGTLSDAEEQKHLVCHANLWKGVLSIYLLHRMLLLFIVNKLNFPCANSHFRYRCSSALGLLVGNPFLQLTAVPIQESTYTHFINCNRNASNCS